LKKVSWFCRSRDAIVIAGADKGVAMQLSYAQNLEDYHLDLVFPGTDGVYVDVGGGHPVADNVSFWFYLKGWRGLVVEPQEQLASLYAGVRPRDRVVTCLAGRSEGEAVFHQVAGLHGLSSMMPDNADKARAFDARITETRKPVRRLSSLIVDAGLGPIDFLKIDVEGAEPEVLAGLDLARHRPAVIVVEAINPGNPQADSSAWEPVLTSAGYEMALFDGLNRFYVSAEQQALKARLPKAPHPWNAVEHLWDCGRAGSEPKHPDRGLAEVLAAGLYAELPLLAPEQLLRLIERGLDALGDKDESAARKRLLGTAEHPGAAADPATLAELLKGDRLRAALGRIACMYDGGHVT
jgi:FkbM family methyltransferase